MRTKTNTTIKTATIELPKGILTSDLICPKWSSKVKLARTTEGLPIEFELWYTARFGWCIPTLLISTNRRNAYGDRTYAVPVKDKAAVVRMGMGPHVLQRHTVYVKQSRLAALQAFLDIQQSGQASAGDVRDRISTRRAVGQQMRAQGRTSWSW